jgi:hypothetical protein
MKGIPAGYERAPAHPAFYEGFLQYQKDREKAEMHFPTWVRRLSSDELIILESAMTTGFLDLPRTGLREQHSVNGTDPSLAEPTPRKWHLIRTFNLFCLHEGWRSVVLMPPGPGVESLFRPLIVCCGRREFASVLTELDGLDRELQQCSPEVGTLNALVSADEAVPAAQRVTGLMWVSASTRMAVARAKPRKLHTNADFDGISDLASELVTSILTGCVVLERRYLRTAVFVKLSGEKPQKRNAVTQLVSERPWLTARFDVSADGNVDILRRGRVRSFIQAIRAGAAPQWTLMRTVASAGEFSSGVQVN